MKHAVCMPNVGPTNELVELARLADGEGWDGVFLWDHLQLDPSQRLEVHDPWVLLGAMASVTNKVRLGTMVTPLPRRRPWVVAKHVITLDHLSGGRAIFGVGLGNPIEADFVPFAEPVDSRTRAQLLDEGLSVLTQLWTGEHILHVGQHFSIDAQFRPAAVQRPRPPIWVASSYPRQSGLDRALQYDGIVQYVQPDGAPIQPEFVAQLVEALEAEADFEIVVRRADDVPVDEYADAGATWGLISEWPREGHIERLKQRILAGPLA